MTALLPRSTPEQQGIPTAAISRLVAALDAMAHVHTLTIVRHGHVVAEETWSPYRRDLPTAMYSASKSFAAIAVGIAVDEGRFGIDDRVIDLLPGEGPARATAHLKMMTVRHLLTMTTGHDEEPPLWGEPDWVATALSADLPHEPGTHWQYNTAATYLLSAIVQRRTGERLSEYLRPRLFEPLGFHEPVWEQSPAGIDAGGFGLSIRPEELAVFGQLLLQRGRWGDRQLVPAAWVDEATAFQVASDLPSADSHQGYGFQFWRCRHGAYRGDGAFGQYVVVLPGADAVVAITGGLADTQQVLDVLWDEVLPSFDTSELPAARVVATPIPAPDGRRRDVDLRFAYEGPVSELRVGDGMITLDGTDLLCLPGVWSVAACPPAGDGARFWYGDQVAVAGGWHGDLFTAEVRTLEDAPTLRLELAATGRLRVTRDVGFENEPWEGDPVAQSAVVAHHIAVSP